MKRLIFALMVILMIVAPVSAADTGTEGVGSPYLSIVSGTESDYFQFNEKGVFVPQTDPPAQLREGWIVLSGQEPVTIKGKHTTIVLQRESILTIGSTRVDTPSFYLVAGSASFLATQPFSGVYEVSTPVGIYRLTGPGEMFVSSDYAELIFSLGGEIRVMNAITRQITDIPSYTYLNLADPFLNAKQISRQTYETISINPDKSSTKTLPSGAVQDGLTFKAPEPLFDTPEIVEEPVKTETKATTVTVPLTIEGKKDLQAKEIVVNETPSEGLALKVSITTSNEAQPVDFAQAPSPEAISPQESISEPASQEGFDFHIVHTNDTSGNLSEDGIGYARLATLLDWGRSVSDKHLILDAGNTVSGTPIADAFEGEPVAVLLDMLGYDAIAPGPGDYAFGLDRLLEGSALASQYGDMEILAANVVDEQGNHLFQPYGIYDLDGYEVGVIGISIPSESITGVSYLNDDIINQAQSLVDEVATQTDFVVVLGNLGTHAGITSSDIAKTLKGIDLIIDGEGARTPAGGRTIGDTLIVNAGSDLDSVGIVTVHVVADEVASIYATRVAVEDVEHPQTSALASQFGITSVPEQPDVARYIQSQQERYTALQKTTAPISQTVAQESQVTTQTAVVPAQKDDPLAIKEPIGIISGDATVPEDTSNWGVVTSFTISRDGFTNSSTPKMGISINPFYHRNSFELGLQAFFLTDGSLFAPDTYTLSNIRSESGLAATVSTAMRFIDYIRYGEEGYPFFLSIDDSTPISFANRVLVNNMSVASGPYEQHLGLYSSVEFGKFGLELFADDLYFSKWLQGDAQTGGANLTFSASPSISLGLSSVITMDSTRTMNAYPAFDFIWRIKNERRLRLDAFTSIATKVGVNPFSFDSVYYAAGTDVVTKLPNFLIAGGLDLQTLAWDARLVAAVQNSTDPLVSLGAFNQTNYSGRRMLEDNAGIHYTIGTELGYQGDRFGFSTSWYVPIEQDFSRIVPIDGTTSTGDRFAIEGSYTGKHFQGAIGFRRVGFISALENLFTSGNFTSGVLEMLKSEHGGLERNSQPYVALRYNHGLFGIFTDISLVPTDADTPFGTYTPRVNLGASVTVGKEAFAEASDPTAMPSVLGSGESDFRGTFSTAYTRVFKTGADDHFITMRPMLEYSKSDSFSIGIGPQVTIDFTDIELYSHDDTPFGFGSTYPSSVGRIYDGLTDALSLLDHVSIGNEDSTFQLAIGGDRETNMGPLVQELTTKTDAVLEKPLALMAKLDTKAFDVDMFLNDLTELQLGGVRMGIAPFKSYHAEFGLSAIGSLNVSDTVKELTLLPAMELRLPVLDNEKVSFDLDGSFTTMLGYNTTSGFAQNFYDASAPTFLGRFDNYLIAGALDLEIGPFSMDVEIAMHEGALSYGMFNPLYLREQAALLDDLELLDPANQPRSFTVGTNLGWEAENFTIKAAYHVPMSASFALDPSNDLFSISSTLDLSWFDMELAYTKRGFFTGVESMLDGSTGIRDFLFDNTAHSSAFSAGVAVNQGPMTFHATVSSLATFNPVAWNQQTVDNVSPALTLGVDINLF